MIATTRGTLLVDTVTEDELGDEVTTAAPDVTGADFPLSLILASERTFDQSTGEWRTIEYYAGRVPGNIDVDEGDRIKDLRDGAIYAVDEFTRTPRGLSGYSSVTLKLRRTAP